MATILFHTIDVSIDALKLPKLKIKHWLKEVGLAEEKKLGSINLIFCSDEYLLEMNKSYLNHDYYTDIITFEYNEKDTIMGDLYISLDRTKENATTNNVSNLDELCRVMVHGVLHLIGYTDKTTEAKSVMKSKEDHYLSLRSF